MNLAVSATAMTVMTPACTGSLTTRSHASGTLPAMLRLTTRRPWLRTSRTAFSISPPISAPASTRAEARGSRATARTASARGCSPTSGNGVDGDALAADVVAVRFGDRADRDLTDLRTPAHDDDALSIDPAECLDRAGVADDGQRPELVDQRLWITGCRQVDLDVDAGVTGRFGCRLDRCDVAVVPANHAGELVQDADA